MDAAFSEAVKESLCEPLDRPICGISRKGRGIVIAIRKAFPVEAGAVISFYNGLIIAMQALPFNHI